MLANTLQGSLLALAAATAQAKDVTLLNVSYDPTRKFYQALNPEFASYYHHGVRDAG